MSAAADRVLVAELGEDPNPRKRLEFARVGRELSRRLDAWRSCTVVTGRDLVRFIDSEVCHRTRHVAIVAHGGPEWLLNSSRGVHVRSSSTTRGQVTVVELAEVLSRVLGGDSPLVSLCSCLCSRSPRWYLLEQLGYAGNDWGAAAYRPGGERSFSATLRDELLARGVAGVRVRGHGTVGHVTNNPILREHGPAAGVAGETLFGLAFPELEPTAAARRQWVELVRGELAARWLLGDDSALVDIRKAWKR